MNTTISRRAVFPRLAGLAIGIGTGAATIIAASDPFVAILSRYEQHLAACPGFSGAEDDHWKDGLYALEDEMWDAMPATRAGAFAALRFVRKECQSFEMSNLYDALMGTAIDILSREA